MNRAGSIILGLGELGMANLMYSCAGIIKGEYDRCAIEHLSDEERLIRSVAIPAILYIGATACAVSAGARLFNNGYETLPPAFQSKARSIAPLILVPFCNVGAVTTYAITTALDVNLNALTCKDVFGRMIRGESTVSIASLRAELLHTIRHILRAIKKEADNTDRRSSQSNSGNYGSYGGYNNYGGYGGSSSYDYYGGYYNYGSYGGSSSYGSSAGGSTYHRFGAARTEKEYIKCLWAGSNDTLGGLRSTKEQKLGMLKDMCEELLDNLDTFWKEHNSKAKTPRIASKYEELRRDGTPGYPGIGSIEKLHCYLYDLFRLCHPDKWLEQQSQATVELQQKARRLQDLMTHICNRLTTKAKIKAYKETLQKAREQAESDPEHVPESEPEPELNSDTDAGSNTDERDIDDID